MGSAVPVELQGFPPGNERLAHRVLDQDIRLPVIQGLRRLGPETQGAGHLFNDQIAEISQAQTEPEIVIEKTAPGWSHWAA